MSDAHTNDELAQLRDADPTSDAALPSPSDHDARTLFEAIVTSEATQRVGGDVDQRRRPLLIAASLAAVAILGGAAVALSGDADDPADTEIAQGRPTEDVSDGAISPGGSSLGSCVEVYDLQTLTRREFAFDGTVGRVAGDEVTFTVNEWYRGGEHSEITLNGATALGGLTSAGPSAGIEPGSRLLVAGDGNVAWSCGFTQPYDPAVAREWGSALDG